MSEFSPVDNLISTKAQLVAGSELIKQKASTTYERGQIFGIKADNKLYELDLTAEDGAEKPYFVLSKTVNVSAGDVLAAGYYVGAFNKAKLKFGSQTAANVYTACRKAGIYPVDFK